MALDFDGGWLDTTAITSQSAFIAMNTTGLAPSAPNAAWLGQQSGTDQFGITSLTPSIRYRVSSNNYDHTSLTTTGYFLNTYTISSGNALNVYQDGTIATESPTTVSGVASFDRLMSRESNRPIYGKAQELILYTSDKSTDRTSIEGNISGYYQSAKLLNEQYGEGAAAAYSVRQLNRDYTGAALQVERSSDNTTQDIGFDSNGDLDESALTTFCTGTTCRVRPWYDQATAGGTGSGNDAVQADHTKQPTIYTGGAIVKENGRVAMQFDGSDKFAAANVQNNNNTSLMFVGTRSTSSAANNTVSYHTGGTHAVYGDNADAYKLYDGSAYASGSGAVGTSRHMYTHNSDGTNYSFFINGSSVYSGTRTLATGTNGLQIGSFLGSFLFNGTMQEINIFDADKSGANQTSIESNIGDYFTQNTPLLDTYTGAAAAYSLRKLRSAYSGSAIRVRRASDNAESDIGFNVFNELDTVSLASFCSGTDGFVKTWYCQSGNSRDVTQTNTANQPKIYDSTTGVVTRNGKPFVMFSTDLGGLPHFENIQSYTISANDECIVSIVYEATTDREQMFQFEAPSSTGINLTANFNSKEYMAFNGNNCQLQAAPTQGTSLSHVLMFADGTDIKGRANGAAYATDASDPISGETSGLATTTQKVRIGRNTNAFCNESYIAELILYPSYSAIESGLESNVNTFYSIY